MTKRLLLLLPTLLLGACASLYQGQAPDDYKDVLKLDDASLNTQISVHGVKQRRAGDLLTVQVVVHNDTYLNHRYRYRLQWLDASGFEIAPDSTGWQPLTLEGNQEYTVVGTAPTAAAQKFHLEFGAQ